MAGPLSCMERSATWRASSCSFARATSSSCSSWAWLLPALPAADGASASAADARSGMPPRANTAIVVVNLFMTYLCFECSDAVVVGDLRVAHGRQGLQQIHALLPELGELRV